MLNTQLNHWLQPQHLQSENLAQYRQAFLDHEAGVLQIDDFLKTDLLQKASQFLHHQLIGKRGVGNIVVLRGKFHDYDHIVTF